jgi:EAL domain-containing protein (putative c-di-GMP-specific phosphodiesterase class I)
MKKSLLLVDDEQQLLYPLKKFFTDKGYEVFTAENGEEALKIMSQYPIQVIMSDYCMPGITGAELLSRIKKNYPATVRLILSGYSDFDAVQKAINEGSIYKFISKPWNNHDLCQSIKEAFDFYSENNKDALLSVNNKFITENDLQNALEQNQFEIYYQPILTADTEKITAVEALLRWHHPTKGILLPDTFIPFCEVSGLIIPIGIWVIGAACAQLGKWQAMGYTSLNIAINLSMRQLSSPGLVDVIKSTLSATSIQPGKLELEITESSIMQNLEQARMQLQSLKDLGVKLSLDDFGTGYSSLAYVSEFPIHILKIDKSFIRDIAFDLEKLELVAMMIQLAKKLNLLTIAEGVETQEQLKKLRELKCDLIQGYLFSPPVQAGVLRQLLNEKGVL